MARGRSRKSSRSKPKGKFKSERQRRFMWSQVPKAAHKWAHRATTAKVDWRGARTSRARRRK